MRMANGSHRAGSFAFAAIARSPVGFVLRKAIGAIGAIGTTRQRNGTIIATRRCRASTDPLREAVPKLPKPPKCRRYRDFFGNTRVPKLCQNMPKVHATGSLRRIAPPYWAGIDWFRLRPARAPRAQIACQSFLRRAAARRCDPILRMTLLNLRMRCLRTEDGRSRSVSPASAPPRRYWVRSSHFAFHLLGSFLTFCTTPTGAGARRTQCRTRPAASRPSRAKVGRWLRFGSGVGWVERSETHRDGQCPSWVSPKRVEDARETRLRLNPRYALRAWLGFDQPGAGVASLAHLHAKRT